MKIALVVAEFNYDITRMMEERAKAHAEFLGATIVKTIHVPGTFEIPMAAKKMLEDKQVEGVAALGAVIEGETKHDELVAQHAARKIMDLELEYGKPVGLGVIGPGATRLQAQARIDDYAKRAVEGVVKMIKRMKKVE